jgi:hypothetical protein
MARSLVEAAGHQIQTMFLTDLAMPFEPCPPQANQVARTGKKGAFRAAMRARRHNVSHSTIPGLTVLLRSQLYVFSGQSSHNFLPRFWKNSSFVVLTCYVPFEQA